MSSQIYCAVPAGDRHPVAKIFFLQDASACAACLGWGLPAQVWIATILVADAGSPAAVCSQPRYSSPCADGRTPDARHEERHGQSAAPMILSGGIFYRRLRDGPTLRIALESDFAIRLRVQPAPNSHPQKRVRRNIGVQRVRLRDLSPFATVDTFLHAENNAPVLPSQCRPARARLQGTA